MTTLIAPTIPDDGAPIITITGDPGIGKTTLAAQFPNPVFIRLEDGMSSIPKDKRPAAFPIIKSAEDLWNQLMWLIKEKHDYKTLVIDSVTQAEVLFTQDILDNDPKKPSSLAKAQGGYGAGYATLASLHQRVRRAAEKLNKERGMAIVFIAHSEVSTIELPDQDPYSRYELRLHKKCVGNYTDNVDMVAYLRHEVFLTGDGDRKKAVSSGDRIAVCESAAAQVSKNRFGITESVAIPKDGPNPFLELIPYFNNSQGE